MLKSLCSQFPVISVGFEYVGEGDSSRYLETTEVLDIDWLTQHILNEFLHKRFHYDFVSSDALRIVTSTR